MHWPRDHAGIGDCRIIISADHVPLLSRRVLVIYRGEIVEQGPFAKFFADPQHPHTRTLLSSVPPDEPEAAWQI